MRQEGRNLKQHLCQRTPQTNKKERQTNRAEHGQQSPPLLVCFPSKASCPIVQRPGLPSHSLNLITATPKLKTNKKVSKSGACAHQNLRLPSLLRPFVFSCKVNEETGPNAARGPQRSFSEATYIAYLHYKAYNRLGTLWEVKNYPSNQREQNSKTAVLPRTRFFSNGTAAWYRRRCYVHADVVSLFRVVS